MSSENVGQTKHILRGHTNAVWAVASSPNGRLLASGSYDQTVRLWDLTDATALKKSQSLHILERHIHWVQTVGFSPDGQILASGSTDQTIRLWNVQTGECLQTLRIPGPYQGMNINGVTGITEVQRLALKALGAVD